MRITNCDNLKLGYGGTREEMERLLADAEKITGIKYDINNFADVTEAIHVVQNEMGITGTVAAEAASTISGSAAMMGAAWQNVILAMASEDLPFDEYVDNFIDTVTTFTSNLIPRVKIALQGVVKLIDALAPVLINTIPDLLSSLLPSLISAAVNLINSVIAILPDLITMLVTSVIPQLLDGIVSITDALVSALPSLIQAICAALPILIPQLISALVDIALILCENIMRIIQPIIDYLPDILISIVDALVTNLPILIQGLISLIISLVQALPQIIQALVDAIPTIISMLVSTLLDPENISAMITGFKDLFVAVVQAWPEIKQSLREIPWKIIAGIVDGIQEKWPELKAKFEEVWGNIRTQASEWWDIIKNSAIGQKVAEIRDNAVKKFGELKAKAAEKWEEIKSDAAAKWEELKNTSIGQKISEIYSKVSTGFGLVKSKVKEIWDGIKEKIETPMNNAKKFVKDIIDKIKGFFDFEFSWPDIPLPHFSVQPAGWKFGDLLEGTVPSLGIEWYAKAMNNPMLLNKATVFGYDSESGNLLGGGEKGAEVVAGANTLMGMIGQAVAANSAAQTDRMVSMLAAILDAITGGNEEMIQALLSGQNIVVDNRVLGRVVRGYA